MADDAVDPEALAASEARPVLELGFISNVEVILDNDASSWPWLELEINVAPVADSEDPVGLESAERGLVC